MRREWSFPVRVRRRRVQRAVFAIAAVVASGVAANVAGPQPGAARTLAIAPVAATLAEDFSDVISVRELADGRVLVTDRKDDRLVVANFMTNTVQPVSRKGDGPGEYRTVGRLWPLAADSTLMSVPYGSRWLILHGATVVTTVSGANPALRATGGMHPLAADATGGVFVTQLARKGGGMPTARDSLFVVRIARATAKVDTIGVMPYSYGDDVSEGEPVAAAGGPPKARVKKQYHVLFTMRDGVAVLPDGTLAIVRPAPYRVDTCKLPARCATGPVLDRARVPVSDASKRAFLKRANALSTYPATSAIDEVVNWPAFVPAFITPGGPDDGNVWATSSGHVVIERTPSDKLPGGNYDVVDGRGNRVATVTTPANVKVIGFGKASVYTLVVDSDGLQHLERRAWGVP